MEDICREKSEGIFVMDPPLVSMSDVNFRYIAQGWLL